MRLIDADRLMDRLRGNVLIDVTHELEETIAQQPAAFDKEKVLEELKAWAKAAKTAGVNSAHSGLDRKASEYYQESKAYFRAVEIVEKGGIE